MKLNLFFKGGKVFLLFLLFIFQSCSYRVLDKEAPAINEIKKGEKFTIILPENHSENYVWKLKEKQNTTVIKYTNAVWHGNEKGIYFNFEAIGNGTDTLCLTQLKYKDTTATTTYILQVTN